MVWCSWCNGCILNLKRTVLGRLYLKTFESKMQPPTMNTTPLCSSHDALQWWWFYYDWMSLTRMISYHGYQNYQPHQLQSHPATVTPNLPRENPHHRAPQMMPYTPIRISRQVEQISQLGNCRIFNKISLSKKTSKTMEEGGPSFWKKYFQKPAGT